MISFKDFKLFGALSGDIIGSPYEFTLNNIKTTDFPLFCPKSRYTDDTVLTLAVAKGVMNGYNNKEKTYDEVSQAMFDVACRHPQASYGKSFFTWLTQKEKKPYNSLGNGSAMRVSSVSWTYNSLKEVEEYAETTASITHNHPEGIKGAKAVAGAIFLARQSKSKEEIKQYVESYGYNLTRSLEEIRRTSIHIETCAKTVPEAVTAFLVGNNFEEVIRTAVSLAGDSDTIAAVAGSIAEAYYPIDIELKKVVFMMLDDELKDILQQFNAFLLRNEK